jgi:hypothetical protein
MEDWQILLDENLDLFKPVKRTWTPEEMQKAYFIYNGHYGKSLRDTGCGSCRRSVLQHLFNIAEKRREELKK